MTYIVTWSRALARRGTGQRRSRKWSEALRISSRQWAVIDLHILEMGWSRAPSDMTVTSPAVKPETVNFLGKLFQLRHDPRVEVTFPPWWNGCSSTLRMTSPTTICERLVWRERKNSFFFPSSEIPAVVLSLSSGLFAQPFILISRHFTGKERHISSRFNFSFCANKRSTCYINFTTWGFSKAAHLESWNVVQNYARSK